MTDYAHDIVVVGSGPGGLKAAIQGAKAGKRVAVVERDRNPGGACVYRGTIPSKTLLEAAQTIIRLKHNAAVFDFNLREDLEVATLIQRLDKVTSSHNHSIRDQLNRNDIDLFHGRAKISGTNQVTVQHVDGGESILHAETIVLATGSRPRTPPDIPVDHENILDSDSLLSMLYLPRSLTVLGSGVIACEYASIFSLLGVKVYLIDRSERPLAFLDEEITDFFLQSFERYGGTLLGGESIQSVQWDGVSEVATTLASGKVIKTEKNLVALGRLANVESLQLDQVGVACGPRGHVLVNEDYQTSVPNIYAVGDLIGPPALASCSMEQGRRAICHALDMDPGHAFNLVPIGIYAVPEIASVGLSEQEAIQKYGKVCVGRARLDETARGLISGSEAGLLKLISDEHGKKILGVQIIGDNATDLIHVGEVALLNGNEVSFFQENILNFPTMSEAYRIAALQLLNQCHRVGALA